MEQGYWLNVAAALNPMARDTRWVHFCRVYCGDHHKDSIEVAKDVAARFPAPEFKCDLTHWQCAGHGVPL